MANTAYDEVADDHRGHEERHALPVVHAQAVPHCLHILAAQHSEHYHERCTGSAQVDSTRYAEYIMLA